MRFSQIVHRAIAIATLQLCYSAASVLAQTPPSAASPDADVVVEANITARELRFNVLPDRAKIEVSGDPQRQTGWIVERHNLPKKLQPGVTYRNVGVRLQITSTVSEINAILSELLGESSTTLPNQTPLQP